MSFSLGRLTKPARIAVWSAMVLVIGAVSGFLGVMAVVYGLVYFGDDSNLKKSTILARINEETNIYMLDEQTQIGSIFENVHRRYVPIDEVPAHMINAIIASEDKNFYTHHGVDPVALVSAIGSYAKTGRMRGASTLTQQTVRNILGWWEVKLSRKFKEWIAAMQLERLYSKRQILEFYLNQFHVSGNGNGIGIAARYYFNKDVRDLDLVESAFIAGSVKGPSNYDPFTKYTKESRERAIKNAYHRKNYVIRRMYEQGWINEAQFKEAWAQPVKFNRGRFGSDEVALVQLIRAQLNKKEILRALNIEDPRELNAAGLKIYTTIDPDMQKGAQLAVRRNLSRLDTILKGFKPESEQYFRKLRSLTVDDFYFGQVTEIGGTEKEPNIRVNFGLPNGTIPYESLMRYAKWLDLASYKGYQKEIADMVKKIKVGDVLYVEVKEYDPETHEAVLELNKRPRINGGLIALDKGEVRAVVSGFDTKGFNRAMMAKRQPGSVFKPVVYFAALQLGWSMLDRLDNERQIFPFQGRFYYPRGDHDSPYRETSMIWSGTMSENLASVALTARLTDKLNFDQYKQLMGTMDLLPQSGEAPRDFHFRVARATGVTLDNEGVREYQLNNAVNDLILDVGFNTGYEYQQRIKKMWWGRGWAEEVQNNYNQRDADIGVKQKAIKIRLAENNFLRFQKIDQNLVQDWNKIQETVNAKGAEGAMAEPLVQQLMTHFRVLAGSGNKPALGYTASVDGERPVRDASSKSEVENMIAMSGRPLNSLDAQMIWGGGNGLFGSAGIELTDVMLDGWLPHGHFAMLAQYVDKHYEEVMARNEDAYDLYRYYQHHDFRIAVGLKYLVNMARTMGVTSKLEPVLSFPLGTNDVSLAEVALLYQTFLAGKTYSYYEEGSPNQLNFIRRIEDRYGNVLYEPKRQEHQLVQTEFALQLREILKRVVTHGTGRRARAEIYLDLNSPETAQQTPNKKVRGDGRIRIPVFGKTGTTNDYTNANFAGFLPYPVEKNEPLDPENSYVLAAYVGYDLNKQMVNGGFKVAGATGALPAWIGLAKDTIEKKEYAEKLDTLDLNIMAQHEWPMKKDEKSATLMVDMPRGVVLSGGSGEQDAVGMSDSSKEGESASDEFRASVVQAPVRVPLDASGQPVRLFSPVKFSDKDLKSVPVQSVSGQPAGASADADSRMSISRKGGTANAGATDGGASAEAKVAPAKPDVGAKPPRARVKGGKRDDSREVIEEDVPAGQQTGAAAAEGGAKTAQKDPGQILKEFVSPDTEETGAGKSSGGDDGAGVVEEELW